MRDPFADRAPATGTRHVDLLLIAAMCTLASAEVDCRGDPFSLIINGTALGCAWALRRWLLRTPRWPARYRWAGILGAAGCVLPIVHNGTVRLVGATAVPWEWSLLHSLRNLTLVLYAVPVWLRSPRGQDTVADAGGVARRLPLRLRGDLGSGSSVQRRERLVVLLSVCLSLFALNLSGAVTVAIGAGTCTWLKVAWLARQHERRFAAAGCRPRRQVLLHFPAAGALLAIGGTIAFGLLLPGSPLAGWSGWLPTSGGHHGFDPWAWRGVGDGDAAVGSDTAQSFGPVATGRFLESSEASLFDVWQDVYGDERPSRATERAVALAPEHLSRAQGASHTSGGSLGFSMQRRGPGRTPSKDRHGDALMFVSGRLPAYLRIDVFDSCDGQRWTASPVVPTHARLVPLSDDWMELAVAELPSVFGERESHAVHIVRLAGSQLPLPPHTRALRIPLVRQSDFYRCVAAGVVALDRRTIPPYTVVETQSVVADPRRLSVLPATRFAASDQGEGLPQRWMRGRVASLARRWAGDARPGWEQIQQVVNRLRRHGRHAAKAAPAGRDALEWFLFESRQGPDYLFAASAVVMLRALGYSTRLAAGFYAPPESYNPRTRQAAVLATHAHFWAEVKLAGTDWLPLEPTPGYELPPPRLSLAQRLRQVGRWVAAFVWAHRKSIAALAAMCIVFWRLRFALANAAATLLWKWRAHRSATRLVLSTLQLIERRAYLAGMPARRTRTPRAWWGSVCPHRTVPDDLACLLQLADWAAFAPTHGGAMRRANKPLLELCQRLVRLYTVACFRAWRKQLVVTPYPRSCSSNKPCSR